MKTGIILFIGTLFFGVIPLQGQKNIRQVVPLIEEEKAPATDTVSLEELKANFKAWYRERDHAAQTPPDLITDDLPWLYKINHYDADLGRKVHYVDTPDPDRLYRAGRNRLPAACWSIDRCFTPTGRQQRLCLHSLSPGVLQAADSAALCLRLERRYGALGEKGVPATWFSGTLGVTANWFPYCNNRVTMKVLRYRVKKGIIQDRTFIENRFGTLAQRQYDEIKATYAQIRRYWDMYLGDIELRHFTEALQTVLPAAAAAYNGRCRFSFLILTDWCGRATLHPLLPEELTTEEKACADRLAQAVRRLPAGLFGHMVTTDGRIFPARYVEGTYHLNENKWTFSDYFFGNRRAKSSIDTWNEANYQFRLSPWFREERPDTISETEAREGFTTWMRSEENLPPNASGHHILTYRSREVLLHEDPVFSPFVYDVAPWKPELLETAGKVSLPKGQWTLCGRYTPTGKDVELCWYGSEQPHGTADCGTPLYRQLARTYGEYPGFGIPARWYSGMFGVSTSHRAYGGFSVCPFARFYRVEKGKVIHSQLLRSRFLLDDNIDGTRYKKVAHWNEGMSKEMGYLAHRLKEVLSALTDSHSDWSFSFMAYGGRERRIRASLVGNPPTGKAEQQQADRLLQAIENLPKDFFGALVTVQGRILPARYIEASYDAQNRQWSFRDYLDTNR